jgi:glycosyltransferase involved in cell wall biosynthesis
LVISIPKILYSLSGLPYKTEILIIDDGSTDNTSDIAEKLLSLQNIPYRIERLNKNQGKGAAIARGVNIANGEYIIFFDADLATSLDVLNEVIPLIEKNTPLIIGSRNLKNSEIKVPQSILRKRLGILYKIFVTRLLNLGVTDVTCGFKCFRKDVARNIFGLTTVNRWGFDAEVLYIANVLKIPINEVPVRWSNGKRTKVKIARDVIQSFFDVLKIFFNGITGAYKKIPRI